MPKKKTGLIKQCLRCGEDYYEYNYQKDKTKFCSTTCANKSNAGKLSASRFGEGNPMYKKTPWNKGRFGIQKGVRGRLNHFWNGGKSSLNYSIRRTNKFKDWRNKIFKRDDWTCQNCKVKGGILDPHHIVSLNEIIVKYNLNNLDDAYNCKKLWDVKNGLTLCHKCHLKTDNYGKHNERRKRHEGYGQN